MKKIILAISAVLFILFSSCSSDTESASAKTYQPLQQVYAYGKTHGDYLGVVRLRTDQQGRISSIYIDDINLPHTWAALNQNDANAVEGLEVIPVKGQYEDKYMAKYIGVGDKYFMGTPNAENSDVIYTEVNADGSPKSDGIANINEYFWKDQNTGAEYMKYAEAGKMYVFKMLGGKLVPAEEVFKAGPGNIFKNSSTYWAANPNNRTQVGFSGNIRYLTQYLLLHGFDFNLETDVAVGDNGVIILDTVTGATMVDSKDYLRNALLAESMLKT